MQCNITIQNAKSPFAWQQRGLIDCGLFYNFAVNFTGTPGGIRFVSIDVHGQRKIGADTNHNVVKNQRAPICIDFDLYNLFIDNAQALRIFRSGMDMALCSDYALA